MQREPFWLVLRAGREPQLPPNFLHSAPESARSEATRLARAHPGVEYVVLASVSAHRTVEVDVVDLRPARDG